jgi:hypothetical protein
VVRPTRERLVEEFGEELVAWTEAIELLFDELPPDDGEPKPDDRSYVLSNYTVGYERVHRDRNTGQIMGCILCGSTLTVDGKYCKLHKERGVI